MPKKNDLKLNVLTNSLDTFLEKLKDDLTNLVLLVTPSLVFLGNRPTLFDRPSKIYDKLNLACFAPPKLWYRLIHFSWLRLS